MSVKESKVMEEAQVREAGLTIADLQQGAALFGQLMSGGTKLKDALGDSQAAQEALYHAAHTIYGQGKYTEAMPIFAYLLTIDHWERRYYSGFGACLQMQHRHRDALKYYFIASTLDLTDPKPVMHSAECYLAIGDRDNARVSLDYALTQARGHKVHNGYIPRLEAMLAFLDGDISKPPSESSK